MTHVTETHDDDVPPKAPWLAFKLGVSILGGTFLLFGLWLAVHSLFEYLSWVEIYCPPLEDCMRSYRLARRGKIVLGLAWASMGGGLTGAAHHGLRQCLDDPGIRPNFEGAAGESGVQAGFEIRVSLHQFVDDRLDFGAGRFDGFTRTGAAFDLQ